MKQNEKLRRRRLNFSFAMKTEREQNYVVLSDLPSLYPEMEKESKNPFSDNSRGFTPICGVCSKQSIGLSARQRN